MVASPVVMVAACVALLLPFATLVGGDDNINVARSSRSFAYATALSASLSWHGFDDGEQLLALRVLLQSLQPIAPRQFFVFVDRTVSTATQNILTSAGATVVKKPNLARVVGVKGSTAVKSSTFDFMYIWTLTDFDRIIYVEPETLVTNKRELDELAMCGKFCAVYMTTCVMSTGLLVVKPDLNEFNSLKAQLASFDFARVPSFFFPDAYFLSKAFPACGRARSFDRSLGDSDADYHRLHFAYNMPWIFHFEKKSWELFRCGIFEQLSEPAATISYGPQLPTILKPWFWWSTLAQVAWPWLNLRHELDESGNWLWFLFSLLFCAVGPVWLLNRVVDPLISRYTPSLPHPAVQKVHDLLGALVFATVLTVACMFPSMMLAVSSFSATHTPVMGWILFICFYHSYFLIATKLVASFVLALRSLQAGLKLYTLRWAVVGTIVAALSPVVDEIVDAFVQYNLVYKVAAFVPTLVVVLGTQFMIIYPLVRTSAIGRAAAVAR
eukprot:m.145527 g.145527  ORF g.145527 m.145527 type:complete len:497 (+) comp17225_c0_seq3:136-1626(+)